MELGAFYRDKVVVITGASSGIGKALALVLADLGARLVLAARREDRLDALAQEIRASGRKALAITTDVTQESDVTALVAATMERWRRLDIYVSNAGQYVQSNVTDMDVGDYRHAMEVNFYASLYAVRQVLPIMKAQGGGHMVFMCTLDAKKGIVGDGPYVASKSALSGFAEVLRQEAKSSHVGVTTVYPGRIDTDMIGHLRVPWISPKISPSKVAEAVARAIPRNTPMVVVPGALYAIGALNELFPRLMDRLYAKLELEGKAQT